MHIYSCTQLSTLQLITSTLLSYLNPLAFITQVLEAELRKKTNHVRTLCEQARSNLRDFCTQKKQLEDFISQMSEWLQTVENSVQASPSRGDPEEISRVKVLKASSGKERQHPAVC